MEELQERKTKLAKEIWIRWLASIKKICESPLSETFIRLYSWKNWKSRFFPGKKTQGKDSYRFACCFYVFHLIRKEIYFKRTVIYFHQIKIWNWEK